MIFIELGSAAQEAAWLIAAIRHVEARAIALDPLPGSRVP
jgi:hypothetical protein